jgi:hypothetical protein
MRRVLILCLMLGLAAGCGRPLAENEAAFAGALFGDSFDVDRVQVAYDVGVFPPPRPRPMVFVEKRAKGDPCARGEPTPVTGPPAAFVAFNRIHYSQSFYTSDAMAGWPGKIRMPHALLLAHELTHIWQWQNREITGYHPVRAMGEAVRNADPYFYAVDAARPFLDYGFEQQAAIVEDFVCYRVFDPSHPKFAELRAILAPVFPVARLDAALAEAGGDEAD